MNIHPAAKLFPMLEDDGPELQELANDIKRTGLRNPILTLDGMVLDGRNRLRACAMAGVEPTFKEWKDGGDPYAFVWSLNGERRHLTPVQKGAIRIKAKEASAEWAKKNEEIARATEERRRAAISESVKSQPRGEDGTLLPKPDRSPAKPTTPPSSEGWERNRLAKEAGTSPATIGRLQKVKRMDPDAFERIVEGKLTLPEALKGSMPQRVDFTDVSVDPDDKKRILMLRKISDDLKEAADRLRVITRMCHQQFRSARGSKVALAAERLEAWTKEHGEALGALDQLAGLIRPLEVCRVCSGKGASVDDQSCASCEGEGFLVAVVVESPAHPDLSS